MPNVLGVVLACGRGQLVHQQLHGTTLLATAVNLLGDVAEAVVVLADSDPRVLALRSTRAVEVLDTASTSTDFEALLRAAEIVVVHDPLCPLVPTVFARDLVARCGGVTALVGVRPVVDTIKATVDGAISGTVDRDGLRVVSSPLVLPGSMAVDLVEPLWSGAHLSSVVRALRSRGPVTLVVAPSAARRVEDSSDLRLMASVDAVSHRVRERG